MIGQTIFNDQVTQKLGEGGMGEVILATDTKLQRRVALKFFPTSQLCVLTRGLSPSSNGRGVHGTPSNHDKAERADT